MLRIFGHKERRSQKGAVNCIIGSLVSCTLHLIQQGDQICAEITGHVAQLGENSSAYGVVVGNLKETGGLNDLGPRHRKNPTKWILHTKDGCGMNSPNTEQDQGARSLEHGNELLGSIKWEELTTLHKKPAPQIQSKALQKQQFLQSPNWNTMQYSKYYPGMVIDEYK